MCYMYLTGRSRREKHGVLHLTHLSELSGVTNNNAEAWKHDEGKSSSPHNRLKTSKNSL